jgi:hypothetical protein
MRNILLRCSIGLRSVLTTRYQAFDSCDDLEVIYVQEASMEFHEPKLVTKGVVHKM